MFPSNIELLKHILEEVTFILDPTTVKSKEDVINDPILSRALIRSLEIIGEASNKYGSRVYGIIPSYRMEKNGWNKKSPYS